jgi:hypothetical protein
MADPNAQTPPQTAISEQGMKDLIAKHRKQIDAVLGLDAQAQMQAVAALGIDPIGLEKHYNNLEVKNSELQRLDDAANKKTAVTGWISFAGGLVGAFAIRKRVSESKLVQGFTTGLSGLAAGLAGTFVGSRVFAGRIRDESRQLALEARGALERELAVTFENREREAAASRPSTASAQTLAANVAPRDPSYTAQAAADKIAASLAPQQRA